MYMAPVTGTRPPSSQAARLLVGTPTLLLAGLVMVPWIAGIALVTGTVLGLKMLASAPRAVVQAAGYAGQVALGR